MKAAHLEVTKHHMLFSAFMRLLAAAPHCIWEGCGMHAASQHTGFADYLTDWRLAGAAIVRQQTQQCS